MSEKLECKRCDGLFTSEEAPIGKCPNCNGTLNYVAKPESSKKSAKAGKKSDNTEADNRRSYWNPQARDSSSTWSPDEVKKRINQNSRNSDSVGYRFAKEVSLEDLVAAQNRTTYAVRSLAVFLFVTLCTAPFGYVLVGAGVDASSDTMVMWGWVIIVTGFVMGLFGGLGELRLSRPQ